jgi:hypothetical protein
MREEAVGLAAAAAAAAAVVVVDIAAGDDAVDRGEEDRSVDEDDCEAFRNGGKAGETPKGVGGPGAGFHSEGL